MKNPLILLPGLLCDDVVWDGQCNYLATDIDCIVPDYGLRDSIAAMAEHVLSIVPTERFSLAGHSMGGRVALEVIRLAPTRVERLALLDTGYQALVEGEAGERERAGRMALLQLAVEKGMRAMGEQWAQGMVHAPTVDPFVYEQILEMIARSTPEKFQAQISALLGRPDATTFLSEISVPTLIVCGRYDQWSPLSRHEVLCAAIRDSQLRVIEQSGHMCTMEQPETVSKALREWLDWPDAESPQDK